MVISASVIDLIDVPERPGDRPRHALDVASDPLTAIDVGRRRRSIRPRSDFKVLAPDVVQEHGETRLTHSKRWRRRGTNAVFVVIEDNAPFRSMCSCPIRHQANSADRSLRESCKAMVCPPKHGNRLTSARSSPTSTTDMGGLTSGGVLCVQQFKTPIGLLRIDASQPPAHVKKVLPTKRPLALRTRAFPNAVEPGR
jgi:hypothetical protein